MKRCLAVLFILLCLHVYADVQIGKLEKGEMLRCGIVEGNIPVALVQDSRFDKEEKKNDATLLCSLRRGDARTL